jgi:hypothetical protein
LFEGSYARSPLRRARVRVCVCVCVCACVGGGVLAVKKIARRGFLVSVFVWERALLGGFTDKNFQ